MGALLIDLVLVTDLVTTLTLPEMRESSLIVLGSVTLLV
jgi:hypothetical protein